MELKGQFEGGHHSISDSSKAVPTPTAAGSLTSRAHGQHSGDGDGDGDGDGCPELTPHLSPFLSMFGSRPRPQQLAFLLWDGMKHLCLLRHSDLRASSTTKSAFIGCLATPDPVIIQAPIERLASELCLPFGGRYYPSGSGVVITVFADNDDTTPVHRSEYYLDGRRDSKTVKVDFANCVIRILCMENFLEDRFRYPGMSYISYISYI